MQVMRPRDPKDHQDHPKGKLQPRAVSRKDTKPDLGCDNLFTSKLIARCYHASVKIAGFAFLLLGTLSIIYNKQGAHAYSEFQKGWGLEERTAILIGRLLGLLGGLLFVGLGLLIILKQVT